MATKLRFKEKAEAIERTYSKMLLIAATDAKAHFVKSFINEGFTDETLDKWKPRKGKLRSLGAYALGKKTLTKTGKLRRSIKFTIGSKSAKVYTSGVIYAAIHNEGGTINKGVRYGDVHHDISGRFTSKTHKNAETGKREKAHSTRNVHFKKHSIQMPKRQFIGNSKILERRTQAKLIAQLKTAIRNA